MIDSKKMINEISQEVNINPDVVKAAYYSYWRFIQQKIAELPLQEDISEEEFNKLKTNFNIPSLGKLTCTYDRLIGVKKKLKYIKQLKRNE